jgi:hypothetical protein
VKSGHHHSGIAKLLHRHKSTIGRELSRNTGSRGYRPKQACEISADRAQNSRNANTLAPWVKDEVNALLRKVYRTRAQTRADVFDFIETFYNPKRRHSTIGYISPVKFKEALFA